MSNAPAPFFRRPTYRAPAPPTWACYEQIPSSDCSDSDLSDDDEGSESEDDDERDEEEERSETSEHGRRDEQPDEVPNMDIDEAGDSAVCEDAGAPPKVDKGKQRAVETKPIEEVASPKRTHRRPKQRRPAWNPRPILTIHKSQGFVWNQDLFVPPYIRDRYVASTSPPKAKGFVPASWSSQDSGLGGYEVEVVEIRVKEGEF
jgi:hypothetical protein